MADQSGGCRVMVDDNGTTSWPSSRDFFERSNAWCDSVGNVMLSIVVFVNSFYCVQIWSYKGLNKLMLLHPMYWTLVVKWFKQFNGFTPLLNALFSWS